MTGPDQPWTIRRVLEWTAPFFQRKGLDNPRLAAELLLAHVLGVPRIRLYTDYERTLGEESLAAFRLLVRRAAEHEPIAYLTGRAHFFGLEIDVTRDVLIPRPETEALVEHALRLIRAIPGLESPRVLDLCTGSGCIAAAVAYHVKTATVVATDASAAAVSVAIRNIERLGLQDRVTVCQGDLYDALRSVADLQPFHLILANPPYIPSGQIASLDRNVRDYEPTAALDGGPDGLAFHRRILAGVGSRLMPGGYVLLEIGCDQGPAACELLQQHAELSESRILKDYAGRDRILVARRA